MKETSRRDLYKKLKRDFPTLETLSNYPHKKAWCTSIHMGVSNWGKINKTPMDVTYLDIWFRNPIDQFPGTEFTKLVFDVPFDTYRPVYDCFGHMVGCLFAFVSYIDTREQ